MRPFSTFFHLLIGLPVVLACQPGSSQETTSEHAIVFSNVNIIDVQNGNIRQGHVVVDSTKIDKILGAETAVDFGDATLIDGTGKYLIPGLAEMHAHIPSLPWDDPKIEETLFLYLSNGITTIRGMLGHPHHLELR